MLLSYSHVKDKASPIIGIIIQGLRLLYRSAQPPAKRSTMRGKMAAIKKHFCIIILLVLSWFEF